MSELIDFAIKKKFSNKDQQIAELKKQIKEWERNYKSNHDAWYERYANELATNESYEKEIAELKKQLNNELFQ